MTPYSHEAWPHWVKHTEVLMQDLREAGFICFYNNPYIQVGKKTSIPTEINVHMLVKRCFPSMSWGKRKIKVQVSPRIPNHIEIAFLEVQVLGLDPTQAGFWCSWKTTFPES